MKPEFLPWLALRTLLGLLLFLALQPCIAASQKPNIVVFLVDDMGVMDTSVPYLTDETGKPKRYPLNEFYRTPNMERLAARGIRFNQFCAMSVMGTTSTTAMKQSQEESILKTLSEPSEIARCIAVIAGMNYITGQVLSLDSRII